MTELKTKEQFIEAMKDLRSKLASSEERSEILEDELKEVKAQLVKLQEKERDPEGGDDWW